VNLGKDVNLDTAINNALKTVKHMPQYRMGLWSMNDWLMDVYKIEVELQVQNGGVLCWPEDHKWKVLAIGDEGLATMFKLKYA
jgi:hypothetical protein